MDEVPPHPSGLFLALWRRMRRDFIAPRLFLCLAGDSSLTPGLCLLVPGR